MMLPTIGGIYKPRHPKSGKPTTKTQKIQPSRSMTYMDFQERRIKWGTELPEGRHLHCVVQYNESTAFVFGGGSTAGPDGQGDLFVNYKKKINTTVVQELRSGFFMNFPDPKQPRRYILTEVADDGKFPCGREAGRVGTHCGLRINEVSGHKELIVPTFEIETRTTCTAILDMQTFQWRKLRLDTRQNVDESLESFLISDEAQTTVYFMGGEYKFGPALAKEYKHIYRLDGDNEWVKLKHEIKG